MRRLSVPPRHRNALVDLANLPDATFDAIRQVLADASGRSRVEISSALGNVFGQEDRPRAADFINAAFSLSSYRTQRVMTVEDAAEGISSSRDLALEDSARTQLKTRLTDVLRAPVVQHLSEAWNLLSQYERSYHGARILTDLRPVFSEGSETVLGAVIVHNLKLEVHVGSRLDTIFVAMDDVDLRDLQSTIARAIAERDQLSGLLTAVNVPGFEPRELS